MTVIHFQNFDPPASGEGAGAQRVDQLRAGFDGLGIDALLVPHSDAYQNEYLPAGAERLAWLSGFTGSAGTALVTRERAVLFTDSRYTLQAERQLDAAVFECCDIATTSPADWIRRHLPAQARLGVDPWLHTGAEIARLEAACRHAGAALVRLAGNPIDRLWQDRPPLRPATVARQPLELAGQPAGEKLAGVRAALEPVRADAALIAEPENVCWLFNLRGGDVEHTPIVLARALVPKEGRPVLFTDMARIGPEVSASLAAECDVAGEDELARVLAQRAAGGARILIDPDRAPARLGAAVEAAGGVVVAERDPTVLAKAIKNEAEIAGTRAAHQRDGVALVRFLAWFDRTAPTGTLDEIAVASALEAFRAQTGQLRDISFDTIAGAGPNGAIVHYRVNRDTARRITAGDVVLIDSGAQYRDGTTDVTRTLVAGPSDQAFRRQFTRVLKGHIAVADARFPENTTGAQLDPLARLALWRAGFDFGHGTGHGVGSYLAVHEGPQRISRLGHEPLRVGMIVSNEPGYYRAGAYGIRIENLLLVREAERPAGGDLPIHRFETLTLAPIDQRLIEPGMLSAAEIAWLDSYHARVMAALSGDLDHTDRSWLAAATRPIA